MGKAQVQRAKAEVATELASVHHMTADAVGPPEQRSCADHVASGKRVPHRRARHAQSANLVAEHARDVEALSLTGCVEHRVVAGAPGSEAEVVAHQHVARMQAVHQHLVDEGLWRLRREAVVEGHDDGLLDATALQFTELVAQRRDAGWGAIGVTTARGEMVARVRLEGQYATRQAAMLCLIAQQRQHRLMPSVHAVEIADRQRAGWCDTGMVEPAKNKHGSIIAVALRPAEQEPPRAPPPAARPASAIGPVPGHRAASTHRSGCDAAPRRGCPPPRPCA